MRQAVKYIETVGGCIKTEYLYFHEHNHGKFCRRGYNSKIFYDGDEQFGYDFIDKYFADSKNSLNLWD